MNYFARITVSFKNEWLSVVCSEFTILSFLAMTMYVFRPRRSTQAVKYTSLATNPNDGDGDKMQDEVVMESGMFTGVHVQKVGQNDKILIFCVIYYFTLYLWIIIISTIQLS